MENIRKQRSFKKTENVCDRSEKNYQVKARCLKKQSDVQFTMNIEIEKKGNTATEKMNRFR